MQMPEMKNLIDGPDEEKEKFLQRFEEDDALKDATDEEKTLFVQYVDELSAKDNEYALRLRCYGKYTGNPVYR